MKKLFLKTVFFSFLLFSSCNDNIKTLEPIKLQGFIFGTSFTIIYYDVHENYNKEVNTLFEEINQDISTYVAASNISKINRGDTTILVGNYFKDVFIKSERIFKETNGYFDPTVGNLVNAWGFGPEKPLNDLDSSTVKNLMRFVGFDKISIKQNKIIKKYPETYLDFNSIGKGYGIDVIARFLESKNIQNYLVEIGGELRVKGTKPDGKLWSIQIENPNTDGTRSAHSFLKLTNISMASSGNYRKFRLSTDGTKYVHTINPKTGFATESNLLAATVIAELDCADVDAYATAFMAMGLEKSVKFLENNPLLKVVLIYVDDEGNLAEFKN